MVVGAGVVVVVVGVVVVGVVVGLVVVVRSLIVAIKKKNTSFSYLDIHVISTKVT